MKFKKYVGSWNVEKQKEITGKIIKIKEKAGKYRTKVYVLETKDEVVDVFGSTVLDEKIHSICEIGNYVKIVFLGMKQGKESEYKDYDIFLGGEE